jgi:hypothetical protein
MSDDAFKARAAARGKRITARVAALGDDDDSPVEGSPASRIELLVELTRAAWAVTGNELPSLPRSQWPVRIRKLGERE